MYHRLLTREPDPQGLSFWTAKLDTGALDRYHVILGFVQSDENFHILIRGWYQQYLGRTPSASEDSFYFEQLKTGTTQRPFKSSYSTPPSTSRRPRPAAGDGRADWLMRIHWMDAPGV